MKNISILGSTGSIGTQALDVCEKMGYNIHGLSAHNNIKLLASQARKYKPKVVCIQNEEYFEDLKIALADIDVKITCGTSSICEIASDDNNDIVLNSIVGIAGLLPTISVLKAKKQLALANKESLVAGGEYVNKLLCDNNLRILPVDSEHSAIFQCMQGYNSHKHLNKIILTASGGPFFGKTKNELSEITVAQALNHPNWSMGAKITIDSATLMNKGLEVIEAVWLFNIKESDIEVVVHRESIVHSAVEFADHSVIAQMGVPDMKIPIQYALTYPKRIKCEVKPLSLTDISRLTFAKPDLETFESLAACKKAINIGGTAPCVVNSANEAAVDLFLNNKIKFLDIGKYVSMALENIKPIYNYSLEDILETDKIAREYVLSQI